ncbi:MAG: hypothetical protein AAGI22_16860 [Planctomycetota bacterium]
MFQSRPQTARAASALLPLFTGALLAAHATAGDVVVEATGTLVQANASGSSPFAGAMVGDPVTVHFEVFVPGMDVVPGQLTNYTIDPATSFVRIGAVTDAITGSAVGIQNDFPVADGIRVFGAPAAGGGSVALEVGESSGTLFSSTDITMQLGTWGPSTWSSFNFGLFGGGSFLEFSNPTVTISLPNVGTSYCGPAPANSSGDGAVIEAFGSAAVATNDLTLRASSLPTQSFGYFLTGRVAGFTMNPGGSQGNLCLTGTIGRFDALVQNSGSAGVIEIPVDLMALPQPNGPVAALPGETWHFQAWFRDANPMVTSNLSDGVEIVMQ